MCKLDEDKQINPYFVMVDSKTGDRFARAVPYKGLGSDGRMDWLVKEAVEELRYWGHNGGPSGHIRIKSDGEASIRSIRLAISKFLGGRVVHEETQVGESESNGRVENAVRRIQEKSRVLRHQIEHNIKQRIPDSSPIMTWLVQWAAELLSK